MLLTVRLPFALWIAGVVVAWLSAGPPSMAQASDASLAGLVTGPAGEPVARALIVAHQTQSGVERSTVTTPAGRYLLVNLPPGSWQIRVQADGYFSGPGKTINLVPALQQTLDLPLVRGGSPPARPAAGSSPLTLLPAGVFDIDNPGQRTIRFSSRVAGSSDLVQDDVNVTPFISRSQMGLVHFLLVPGSFLQVRLTAAQFTADSNMTPGGQRAIVTRSGVNRWHWQVFGIPRNGFLAANAGISSSRLKFESNQYGGSLSGPIRENNSHFFIVYAGLRQTAGEILTGYVPTPSFRAQVKKDYPVLAPLLAAYPAGTQPIDGSADSMTFLGVGNQLDNEDALTVRLDEELPPLVGRERRDSLFFRGSLDSALIDAPVSQSGTYLTDLLQRRAHPLSGVFGWSHRFSPTLTDDLRLAYVRNTFESTYQGSLNLPYSLAVSGFTTLAGNQTNYGASNVYSLQDSAAWIRGKHSVLAGAELRRQDLNLRNSDAGAIDYASFAELAANQISTASFNEALPSNGLSELQSYGWVQENWRLRANLVLGAGVRYQFFNRLHEVHGKAIPFDFSTCGSRGFCAIGASFGQQNVFDFDPRLSVAWAPDSGPEWLRSRVLVRAGAGLYHTNGLLADQSQPIYNEVRNYSLSSADQPGLSYPITPFLAGATGVASAQAMDRRRRDSYVNEWSLSVQGLLPAQWLATASYFGAQGIHLASDSYVNLINPATQARPYAAFGQVNYHANSGSSTLEALAILAQHDLRHGLQLTGGYNWAHQIDDGASGAGEQDAPENPACPRCDRASGDGDLRQTMGLYAIYSIPVGSHRAVRLKPVWLNRVLGDWDAVNTFTARTGLPVNVTVDRSATDVATGYTVNQRPDRVRGVSLTPPGGPSFRQWLNPAAFTTVHGLYGTAGRNLARGPSAWQLDSGLMRNFPLPRKAVLNVRVNAQNIFNHAQYGQPLSDWSTPQFGEIVSLSNTVRVGSGGPRVLFFSASASF
jgi:hypothetical protein